MSGTKRSIVINSGHNTRRKCIRKFQRKNEFIPRGHSKAAKERGVYGYGVWVSNNHIRGILIKFIDKPFNDFYSYFSKLYQNTTYFDDISDLIPIYVPIVINQYNLPCVRKVHVYKLDQFKETLYEDLDKSISFPEETCYIRYKFRPHLYSFDSLKRCYKGCFYLDANDKIQYIPQDKSLLKEPYNHIGKIERARFRSDFEWVYVDKFEKRDITTESDRKWEVIRSKMERRAIPYKTVSTREMIQKGTTSVLTWDIDDEGNIFSTFVEMPRLRRKKLYRYSREYSSRKEKKQVIKQSHETTR